VPLQPKQRPPNDYFMSIIEDNNKLLTEDIKKTISYESSIKRLYKKKYEEDKNLP